MSYKYKSDEQREALKIARYLIKKRYFKTAESILNDIKHPASNKMLAYIKKQRKLGRRYGRPDERPESKPEKVIQNKTTNQTVRYAKPSAIHPVIYILLTGLAQFLIVTFIVSEVSIVTSGVMSMAAMIVGLVMWYITDANNRYYRTLNGEIDIELPVLIVPGTGIIIAGTLYISMIARLSSQNATLPVTILFITTIIWLIAIFLGQVYQKIMVIAMNNVGEGIYRNEQLNLEVAWETEDTVKQ